MITLILWFLGLVPSFHDWPHRDRHGACRCRCFACTRVCLDATVVWEQLLTATPADFPWESRPVERPIILRRPQVRTVCPSNRRIYTPAPILRSAA